MNQIFDKLAGLSGFTDEDAAAFFAQLADLDPAGIGAVLGYLLGRLDGDDAATIVRALRKLQPQREIPIDDGRITVNILGTGGGPSTFNITTTSAFVVAAAGVVVVKTGSAASRSKAGFADVAAKLGTLKLSMPWERAAAIARDAGIVFIPQSYYPPAMVLLVEKLTQPVHRNVAAYFNKIGPLLAPIRVDHRVIGADSFSCLEMLAEASLRLGDIPATFVSAADGMDEASTTGSSRVVHILADGRRIDETIDPSALGIAAPALEELRGDDPVAAAECCERILSGKGTPAQVDIVALNAGLVLASVGLCADLPTGCDTARRILQRGDARKKLTELRAQLWKRSAYV